MAKTRIACESGRCSSIGSVVALEREIGLSISSVAEAERRERKACGSMESVFSPHRMNGDERGELVVEVDETTICRVRKSWQRFRSGKT